MRRLVPLALLAGLALPASASAGPAKISPSATPISAAGVTKVEVANTARSVLRGKAEMVAGQQVVATRSVRLRKRSVGTVRFTLVPEAIEAVRTSGGRVRILMTLRRPGGRRTTARRTLTLLLPAGAPAPAPDTTVPADQPQATTPPPAPAPTRFAGRMGSEGEYDDLELTVENGLLTITKAPVVPVTCAENGGSYAASTSFELFDAPGPWTVGTDGSVEKQGVAVNQLVYSGERTITYKVTETSADADRVAGKLGMSFFHSEYDPFTNAIAFVNCFGSQSFEAVPAG